MSAGTFIIIDGIDGSGKSSIVEGWREYLGAEGKNIFDLKTYLKQHNRYPAYSELESFDVILNAEPSYAGIGKVIRDELIKNGTRYPALAVAEAYSLDRLILYTKIVIPALADGKIIIQDRSVTTSLCYQPLSGEVTVETVAALPGNALALEYRPDHLVLVSVSPDTALARLGGRGEKQDDVIFEHRDFLEKSNARFLSPEYQSLFSSRGTVIHQLSGDPEIGIMKQEATDLLKSILK